MKEQTTFVLRNTGTSRFVKTSPHEFLDENFVEGWDNLAARGALTFGTHEAALIAKDADPDGCSLAVEEI
jgi:hypothetical protein